MTDRTLVYRCAPGITWVRDADQTLLVDGETGRFWSLQGVEAAMWDWLTLAYPYEKIVRLLSLLLDTSADEAGKKLITALLGWWDAGIVQLVGQDSCGEPGDQCCL